MKKSNKLYVMVSLIMVCSMLFMACSKGKEESKSTDSSQVSEDSNFNETGFPIVNEPITLKVVSQKASLAPNYSEMPLMQSLVEKSNIKVEWNNIPETDFETKRNLLLAGDELPDVFWNGKFTDYDLVKYGKEGLFIPLNDLIEKYMPNLSAEIKKDPTIKAKLTAPDGNIYSLPGIEQTGLGRAPFFSSINTAWLDKLGLKMPTTPEEFKEVLVAFKTQDPNGNGKADEIPFSFMHVWWCADIGDLMAAFGMPDNVDHRIVRDNKVIYTAVQDEYKEAIKYFHDLYAEGLIDPESFTQDPAQYLAKGQNEADILGSFVWWETAEVVGPSRVANFEVMEPFFNAEGKRVTGRGNGEDFSRAAAVITKDNKHVPETLRWIDMMYDKYLSPQINWGPEGDVFTKNENGVLVMGETPDGSSMGEYRQKVCPGGGSPIIITKDDFGKYVDMEPRAKERLETIKEKFDPYMEPQNYPLVFLDGDELEELNMIETDIKTTVNNKRAEWIMNGGIDEEWDSYVNELNKMGLERMITIYQNGLDRYNENAGK